MTASILNQRKWYKRQKNFGIVYLLTVTTTGDTYIGSTTNSLGKRLQQHKARPLACLRDLVKEYGNNCLEIQGLYWYSKPTTKGELRQREQIYIKEYSPTLNKINAVHVPRRNKCCYKGGITYKNKWYPTKLEVWKQHGKVALGTFKSRIFRGKSLEEALF